MNYLVFCTSNLPACINTNQSARNQFSETCLQQNLHQLAKLPNTFASDSRDSRFSCLTDAWQVLFSKLMSPVMPIETPCERIRFCPGSKVWGLWYSGYVTFLRMWKARPSQTRSRHWDINVSQCTEVSKERRTAPGWLTEQGKAFALGSGRISC